MVCMYIYIYGTTYIYIYLFIIIFPPNPARFYAKLRSALFGRKPGWKVQAQVVQGRRPWDLQAAHL
jgi:hypothetical protein